MESIVNGFITELDQDLSVTQKFQDKFLSSELWVMEAKHHR
jgi:hypothetical protein